MSIQFKDITLPIPSGTGFRRIEGTVSFPATVLRAGVALNGFKLDFVTDDHYINITEADTDIVSVSGRMVTIAVECDFSDKNFDGPYRGYVTALVIAETA